MSGTAARSHGSGEVTCWSKTVKARSRSRSSRASIGSPSPRSDESSRRPVTTPRSRPGPRPPAAAGRRRPARPPPGSPRRGKWRACGPAPARAARASPSSSRPPPGASCAAAARSGCPDEQREPVVKALGELSWRQRTQPHRGQLDRQRHPVKRTADPGGGLGVGLIELEVRPDGDGPVPEQADRPVVPAGAGLSRRHRQRRYRAKDLAVDAERLPAGDHDPHPRAGRQDVARQRGGRLDHMLAVVEDHHLVPVRERGGQPFQRA